MELEVKKNQRILVLDYARLFMAYMVIFHHLIFPGFLRNSTVQFTLPLFFLVSGMLDKHIEFGSYLKKNARLILVPVLSFLLLFFLYYGIFFGWDVALDKLVVSLKGFMTSGKVALDAPLWFFTAFFAVKLLSYVFEKVGWVWSILIWLTLLLATHYICNPFFLASSVMAMPIFMFGYLGKGWILDLTNRKWFSWFWVAGFLLVCLVYLFNGRVSMNMVWFGHGQKDMNPLWMACFYLVAIVGSLSVLSFSTLFKNSYAWLRPSVDALITIVCGQFLLVVPFWALWPKSSYPVRIVASLVILVFCVFLHMLISKYAPFMLGRFEKPHQRAV